MAIDIEEKIYQIINCSGRSQTKTSEILKLIEDKYVPKEKVIAKEFPNGKWMEYVIGVKFFEF